MNDNDNDNNKEQSKNPKSKGTKPDNDKSDNDKALPIAQWQAYLQQQLIKLQAFEQDLAANQTRLLKCWFHVDIETLQARLNDEEADPQFLYQIDWNSRKKLSKPLIKWLAFCYASKMIGSSLMVMTSQMRLTIFAMKCYKRCKPR